MSIHLGSLFLTELASAFQKPKEGFIYPVHDVLH